MQNEIGKFGIKIHKGYFKRYEVKAKLGDFDEDIPVPCRKRKQRRFQLTVVDRLDIVHQVLVQCKMVVAVAKQYRITQNTVRMLVVKAKKKPKFMAELLSKQAD